MRRLVLATGNPDKKREIEPLLAGVAVELVPVSALVQGWSVEETGATLEANARLKAEAAALATDLPAVADDTGLFVDALGGAPGVRSSRYAGPEATYADNLQALLAALDGIPPEDRGARFRTVVAVVRPDGAGRLFAGEIEGAILAAPRGAGRFGYDPVFLPAGTARTLAELPLAEKNRRSHRARAFAELAAFLRRAGAWLEGAPAREV